MCLPCKLHLSFGQLLVTRFHEHRYSTWRRLLSVFEGPDEVARGTAFPLECNFDARYRTPYVNRESHSIALELTVIVPSGAVVFDKGCYIGQELTARTKFRGEVCSFCHTFSLAIPSECEYR